MKIVHAADMKWGENLAAHRGGGIHHKVLFEGEEGSADNFLLVLAKESADYFSPRHRHPWDQVRYCLEGSVPVGRDLSVDAGEVGYFPEGVAYGPQEGGGDRIELLLQFGGASGQGYLSAAEVKRAREELARDGAFESGVYKRGGKNSDAYEAIWQHVTGKKLEYPAPRYKAPIVMRADRFPWRGGGEVRAKAVGEFPGRGLMLAFFAIGAGGTYDGIDGVGTRRFLFVSTGEGTVGAESYRPLSVIMIDPDEILPVNAEHDSEFFEIAVAPVDSL